MLKRLGSGVLLLVVISSVTYLLVYSAGKNVARTILGDFATPRQVELKAHELGIDRPLPQQFLEWFGHTLTGNFGTSWFTSEPVTSAIVTRLPVTLTLVVIVITITAVLATGLGIAAARSRGFLDRALQLLTIVGYSVPPFIVAIVLVTIFAVQMKLFPATGFLPFDQDPAAWGLSLVLPVTALLMSSVAAVAQQVRSAMIEGLQQDWVRTLRSRGLGEFEVLWRHVLRAAAPAGFTVLAIQFVGLLGGTVLIEQIFALPGLGFLAVQSTTRGDLPVILGVVVFNVIVVIIVNLVIDLVVAWLNPKVRLT